MKLKTLLKFVIVINSLIVFSNCSTIQPHMLKPEVNENQNKIHYLKIKGSDVAKGQNKTLRGQNQYFTYVERELDQNIFIKEDKCYGEIDIAVIYNQTKVQWYSWPVAFISTLTLGIPQILYVPYSWQKVYLEIDVSLYGNNGKVVKKYNYNVSSIWEQGFYRNDMYVEYLDNWKDLMSQLKADLNKDYKEINRLLEESDI